MTRNATRPMRRSADQLEALHEAFTDESISREACAAMFGIGKNRLFQIAHKEGWLPAERRPSRGPIKYQNSEAKPSLYTTYSLPHLVGFWYRSYWKLGPSRGPARQATSQLSDARCQQCPGPVTFGQVPTSDTTIFARRGKRAEMRTRGE